MPECDVASLLPTSNDIPNIYQCTQEELDAIFKEYAGDIKFEEFMQYPDQATSDLIFTDDGIGETGV